MSKRELFPSTRRRGGGGGSGEDKSSRTMSPSPPKSNHAHSHTNSAHQTSAPLTQVQLSHQQLGDDAMESIAVLCQHSPIETLDLSFNLLGAAGAKALLDPLASGCPTLTAVNLSHNLLGDDGAAVIASVLANHPSITEMDLSANEISFLGAQKLARALSHARSLTSLRLGSNPLAGGSIALALALQACPRTRLSELILSETLADDACAEHFILALAHCPRMRRLDLRENEEVASGLMERIVSTLDRRDSEEHLVRSILRATSSAEPEMLLESLKQQVLQLPLPDYCCELSKLLLTYYDELDQAIQHRLAELDPSYQPALASHASADSDSHAGGEQGEFVPVRPRKNSRARKEAKAALAAGSQGGSSAACGNHAASSSKLNARSNSAMNALTTDVTPESDDDASPTDDSASSSMLDSSSIPDRVKLYAYLWCFPLVAHKLSEQLGVFKRGASAGLSSAASSPSVSITSPHAPLHSPVPACTLMEAYSGLELLVGVLLLRADKSVAAQRARMYVKDEYVRVKEQQRRAPHLYRGNQGAHQYVNHTTNHQSMPSTPVRKRGGGAAGGNNDLGSSPPDRSGRSGIVGSPPLARAASPNGTRESVSLPSSPQRPTKSTGGGGVQSLGKYPFDHEWFESCILQQIDDSFTALLGLSTSLRAAVLAQVSSLHALLGQDDLEILDHIFRILAKESLGQKYGQMQLLDELRTVKAWTKIPELSMQLNHSHSQHQSSQPSFLKQVYRCVEESIASRFDALQEEDDLTLVVTQQPSFLKVEDMTPEEAEKLPAGRGASKTTSNGSSSISAHSRGSSSSQSHSGGGGVGSRTASSLAAATATANESLPRQSTSKDFTPTGRPIQPLLKTMKSLLLDLKALKHKIGPLVARTQREAKARHREWMESAEAKGSSSKRGQTTANGSNSSSTLPPPLDADSFDLFSFAFERYHQRFMHSLVSPRFRPAGLALQDILACVSWIGVYGRFLKTLFPGGSLGASIHAHQRGGSVSSIIPHTYDFSPELDTYADEYLTEWCTRQQEKARPWWRNIFSAEIQTEPERQDNFGDEEEKSITAAAKKPNLYYCTHAPQDLYSKLNGFVDLVLGEEDSSQTNLRGRGLYRVGEMLVGMIRVFLTEQHVKWVTEVLKLQVVEWTPVSVESSLAKEKDYIQACNNAASNTNTPLSTPRFSTASKSLLSKLSEAYPVRKGGENRAVLEKATRRKREKQQAKEKEQEEKRKKQKEKEKEKSRKDSKKNRNAAAERDGDVSEDYVSDVDDASSSALTSPNPSVSSPISSASSAHGVPRPLNEIRPTLIHLLAQLNNVSLYRFHGERLSDQLLDQLEREVEELEDEREQMRNMLAGASMQDGSSPANGESNSKGEKTSLYTLSPEQQEDEDYSLSIRTHLTSLESQFDELEELFTDYSIQIVQVLSEICLDRCIGLLQRWWMNESMLKKVYSNHEKDAGKSPSSSSSSLTPGHLIHSLLLCVSEFLSFILPQIRKPLEAELLLKYVSNGLCVTYLSYLFTTAFKSLSFLAPQRRLSVILEHVRSDTGLMREFWSCKPMKRVTGTNDEEDEDEEEKDDGGDDTEERDNQENNSIDHSLPPLDNTCIRAFTLTPKDLSSFQLLETGETLLTADDEFLHVHFEHLLQRFPFDAHNPFTKSSGWTCILLLQSCMKLRCDLESKRRTGVVGEFIAFVKAQQIGEDMAITPKLANGTTNVGGGAKEAKKNSKPKHERKKDSDDCVIA